MKILSTEILLEYLVEGDSENNRADSFFKSRSHAETYFLNNIVLSEVAAFFEENVKFDKTDVVTALRAFIFNSQIRLENRQVVMNAVKMYEISRSNFAECLKKAINKNFQQIEDNRKMNSLRKVAYM